jgi:UDP-N-acetylglucosamine:LPS N-acetylglucosamine transferase
LKRIAVILGRGGHTAQTFALVRLLGPTYEYLYLIGVLDSLTRRKIDIPGLILPVIPPRLLPQDSRLMSILRTIVTLVLSFFYLLAFRPRIIISCGTGLTVPIFYAARVIGVKTVFIESMSRVESLSMTGRLLLGKTDLFIVQWPSLAAKTPGVTYGGQLL